MAYQVIVLPTVDKAVAQLPRQIRARIAGRLATLADNPRPPGSVKLKGQDTHRIRVGDYRIIYTIRDQQLIVTVIDIGHRREVYRRH